MEKTNEQMVAEYNSTKDERVLQALIKANTGLLHLIITPYMGTIPNAPEFEDLYQEVLGFPFMRAIKDFDSERGVAFTTLVKVYARQWLNRIYERENAQVRCADELPDSLNRLQEINKDGEIEDRNFTVDCLEYGSVEFRDFINSIDFTVREKVIVNMLMGGESKVDCAELLDCEKANISYYVRRIREKMLLAGYTSLTFC